MWVQTEEELKVSYEWKVGNQWNHLKAIAEKNASLLLEGSEEEFITEHYWGYTFIDNSCTGSYEVKHPKWKVHKVKSYDIKCNAEALYGRDFVEPLLQPPLSVFLAEGSKIGVMKKVKIFAF
jgi:hypothetical protein